MSIILPLGQKTAVDITDAILTWRKILGDLDQTGRRKVEPAVLCRGRVTRPCSTTSRQSAVWAEPAHPNSLRKAFASRAETRQRACRRAPGTFGVVRSLDTATTFGVVAVVRLATIACLLSRRCRER
jgi:hypothetical protein